MTTKTTTKPKEPRKESNDAMLVNILDQLDILTNSIRMIDSDMEALFDKVNKLTGRMGIE
tara:strand:- start:18424 stop:18603 length:180 start_codon:yes stop_codon:yes gene_type:complete